MPTTGPTDEEPDEDRKRLQDESLSLQNRLESLKRQRRRIHFVLDVQTKEQLSRWQRLRNLESRAHERALLEYQSEIYAQRAAFERLNVANRWNVTNDCFFIWHRGPFGTINGLRCASEVPALPSYPDQDASPSNTGGRSFGILGYSYSIGLSGDSNTAVAPDGCKVPWVEINSALGMVALLLSTLEQKPNSGIRFHNEILALGSTSRIGVKSGQSVTLYNLFSDDSFQLFGKRNFNIALTGLLRCVFDAGEAVQTHDKTIALPYPIDMSNRGDCTIGGLTIAFGPDTERWTRAMKYLLTDLKWLIAFTTKHVDR